MTAVFIYAALLAIIFVVLSLRTIRLRRRLKVALGDGGNHELLRAMRVHSNFTEYVPFCLVMLLLVSQHAQVWFVHVLGLCLLCGRLLHAVGVSQPNENFKLRISGMFMTFSVLLVASGYLLFKALF